MSNCRDYKPACGVGRIFEAPEGQYIPTQLSDGCGQFQLSTLERLDQKDVEAIVPGFQWFDEAGSIPRQKRSCWVTWRKNSGPTRGARGSATRPSSVVNQKEALCTQTKMLQFRRETCNDA